MIDLENTQCISCGSTDLRPVIDEIDPADVYHEGIRCDGCGKRYSIIWGVPYLGVFTEDEILSLLEIAASSDEWRRGSDKGPEFLKWIEALDDYTVSPRREETLKAHGVHEKPDWFDNRYTEHLWFLILTAGLPLAGKSVLDVGAGAGYDSLKLARAGAKVTALEFNPLLAGIGFGSFPGIRWIGGSAHCLPFGDSAFDFVVANATLHHLTDLPRSLRELLRVVKPGGYLLSLCDPFSRDSLTETQEAAIFNDHTHVLSGINEQSPRFGSFMEALREYRDSLDIRIFTHKCYATRPYPCEWKLDDALEKLPHDDGSICFLIRKKAEIAMPVSKKRGAVALEPSRYALSLGDKPFALAMLVDLVPEKYVDLPLLDERYPKFRLLNGWKLQVEGNGRREAFGRARLFYSVARAEDSHVRISVLIPYVDPCDSPAFSVSVNGKVVHRSVMTRGIWHDVAVPLRGEIRSEQNFYLEMGVEAQTGSDDGRSFYVRSIDFAGPAGSDDGTDHAQMESFGCETLVAAGTIRNRAAALLCPDFEHCLHIIHKLRGAGVALDIVVEKGQESLYAWMPEVRVVGSYPREGEAPGTKAGDMPLTHGDILLLVAPTAPMLDTLYGMIPDTHAYGSIYALGAGGHAILCAPGSFDSGAIERTKNTGAPSGYDSAAILSDLIFLRNHLSHSEMKAIVGILKKYPFFIGLGKKFINLFK